MVGTEMGSLGTCGQDSFLTALGAQPGSWTEQTDPSPLPPVWTEKSRRRSVWQRWPRDGMRAQQGMGKGGGGLLLAGWGSWEEAALVTHQALPGLLRGTPGAGGGAPWCFPYPLFQPHDKEGPSHYTSTGLDAELLRRKQHTVPKSPGA